MKDTEDDKDTIIYEVPGEMSDLMQDCYVAKECRDIAIQSYFKAKRAIYYGKKANKANNKFWDLARTLYPMVADHQTYKWSYVQNLDQIVGEKKR